MPLRAKLMINSVTDDGDYHKNVFKSQADDGVFDQDEEEVAWRNTARWC